MSFTKEGILQRTREVQERMFGKRHGARAELARLLGVHYNTLKSYEEETVNIDFLRLLAEKTGTDLYWLLFGEEQKESKTEIEKGEHIPCQVVPSMKILPYYLTNQINLGKKLWMPSSSVFEIIPKGVYFCCLMDKDKPCGMEPVIERGDVVFVERASYDLEKGFPKKHRIYLIRHDNDFFFRYLSHHVRPDQTSTLVVTSEDRSSGMDFIDLPMDSVKATDKIEKVVIGHVVYITKKRP